MFILWIDPVFKYQERRQQCRLLFINVFIMAAFRNIFLFIKKYPISLLTIALIWYLCFFTPPSTGLDEVIGFDKVVHFGMYFFLGSVILWEQKRDYRILFALVLPILMSGLIEILQQTCTGGRRSGDIWDFAANSLGAIAAWYIARHILKRIVK